MANLLKHGLNEFRSGTKGSVEKAVGLFVYHAAALKSKHTEFPTDVDYTKMNDRTAPLAVDLESKFNIYKNIENTQLSHTEEVRLHLEEIQGENGLARDWFDRTSVIYKKADPVRFKAIFPKGLKPFRGKKDDVISAVGTLSLGIGADTNPLMIAIKAEVDAEFALIDPSRHDQKEAIFFTKTKYDELVLLCDGAMDMEYRNAGLLMDKFPLNEGNIQDLFHDMELLIGKQQTEWDVAIDAVTIIELTKRTLLASTKLKATAHFGSASIFLSSTPGGTDSTPVVLLTDIETKFTAADFGITDFGSHRHITIKNTNNETIRIKFKIG